MTKPLQTRPLHIAIIMDGNGRWATLRQQPRLVGHAQGVETVKQIVRSCPSLGINTLTLFAFAIANWKRDAKEVEGLWDLLCAFLASDLHEFIEGGARVQIIGRRNGLPSKVVAAIAQAEKDSALNNRFFLQVAINYDGLDEVARCLQKAIHDRVPATAITPEYVRRHLDTQESGDPDIVIRTGMDAARDGMAIWRSSAFLPLQSAQSVCVSTEVLWPDFTPEHLRKIIAYAKPEMRLFGGQRR